MRNVILPVMSVLLLAARSEAEPPARWMLELTLRGRQIEGSPLAWNTQEVFLLGRDGRLWQFAPEEAKDFRKTSSRFESYSTPQLRAMLLRDLGGDFAVTGTGHYLVAHPRGEQDRWARRLEELYRSFVHYFSVRGFTLEEPPCPLVGIVCRSRGEFLDHSRDQGSAVGQGIQGYYSLRSNRILLYDLGGEASASTEWQQNASTLIHEATHQTAFNTGIHSRLTPPPVWVAEGLAMMFEARGVYNSQFHPRPGDRINRLRLGQFNQLVVPRHQPELLADLVASDRLFRVDPAAAYATAWALTFYLVETQPGRYAEYLACTADRPPLQPYAAAGRTADFVAVFGDDWPMLKARVLRFVEGLR
jgi:hypothetical protein